MLTGGLFKLSIFFSCFCDLLSYCNKVKVLSFSTRLDAATLLSLVNTAAADNAVFKIEQKSRWTSTLMFFFFFFFYNTLSLRLRNEQHFSRVLSGYEADVCS